MTFPGFFDDLTGLTHPADGAEENVLHRAILTAHEQVLHLDTEVWQTLTDAARAGEEGARARKLEDLSTLLKERTEWGEVLADFLTLPCTPTADDPEHPEDPDPVEREGEGIVAACRRIFHAHGDPGALSTAVLVRALRSSSGVPFGAWQRDDLTARGLSNLLAPYGIRPGNVRLPDGSRRKGYRRLDFTTGERLHCPDLSAGPMPATRTA